MRIESQSAAWQNVHLIIQLYLNIENSQILNGIIFKQKHFNIPHWRVIYYSTGELTVSR